MRPSIQARLLVLSLLSVLGVAMGTAWFAYREAVHEVDELVDAQLVQYARIMLALAHAGDDDEVDAPHVGGHRYASQVIFQIWERDRDGDKLLLRSPEAPHAWPDDVAREGYSNMRLGDSSWRCFAATDNEGGRYTLAAMDLRIQDELVRGIAMGNVRPYLYGLPILALLLVWAIRSGLAPLRRLDADLAGSSPERLDPIAEDQATHELLPLIQTMNRLFLRVTHVLDNERRFTSDAAHELRTPLAAIKAQLQVAERTPDASESRGAVRKAMRGADRMTHLVTQLLSLARLEGKQPPPAMFPVSLTDLAEEAAGEAAVQAGQQRIAFECALGSGLSTVGNPDLLRVMLRNVLDNALRYTPTGGRVRFTLEDKAQRIHMAILDSGPGVAPENRQKLGERFQRFGSHAVEGVGLGLSIVRRIADLHAANLVFSAGLDGAGMGVTVIFQPAAAG